MSRIVEREYVEDDRGTFVDRPFYTSPIAIALAVIAIVLLLWLLIAAPFSDGTSTPTDKPTNNTAPVDNARETGGGAGGDQTGGGSGDAGGGGANTGNGGNTNSGADGGAGGTP